MGGSSEDISTYEDFYAVLFPYFSAQLIAVPKKHLFR